MSASAGKMADAQPLLPHIDTLAHGKRCERCVTWEGVWAIARDVNAQHRARGQPRHTPPPAFLALAEKQRAHAREHHPELFQDPAVGGPPPVLGVKEWVPTVHSAAACKALMDDLATRNFHFTSFCMPSDPYAALYTQAEAPSNWSSHPHTPCAIPNGVQAVRPGYETAGGHGTGTTGTPAATKTSAPHGPASVPVAAPGSATTDGSGPRFRYVLSSPLQIVSGLNGTSQAGAGQDRAGQGSGLRHVECITGPLWFGAARTSIPVNVWVPVLPIYGPSMILEYGQPHCHLVHKDAPYSMQVLYGRVGHGEIDKFVVSWTVERIGCVPSGTPVAANSGPGHSSGDACERHEAVTPPQPVPYPFIPGTLYRLLPFIDGLRLPPGWAKLAAGQGLDSFQPPSDASGAPRDDHAVATSVQDNADAGCDERASDAASSKSSGDAVALPEKPLTDEELQLQLQLRRHLVSRPGPS